jgi:glutamate dehydrogenase/leucine dehydrogenase
MKDAMTIATDELGPETMVFVHDADTGMKGVLVIDNSVLGPTGGGARMLPDLTAQEVADLARAMTYKFGILGLPRGGCKSGLWGDANMPAQEKRDVMRAFGRLLGPYITSKLAAIGPDMGVTVRDVADIYEGAGAQQLRSGLFEQVIDHDAAAYHLTGHGVIAAAKAAAPLAGLQFEGSTIAVEGFGQVGVGVARRAVKEGAKVVAISTIHGAIYHPNGLDIPRLLELRREFHDHCVLQYSGADRLPSKEIYYVPVQILVPGARPYVIDRENADRIRAKLISSGGNITLTDEAQELLFRRGVISVPDFIANSGAAVASWVDFLAGTTDQAFRAIDGLIGRLAREVVSEAIERAQNPLVVAKRRVRERILAAKGRPRKSFEETKQEIRQILGVF